MSGSDQEPGSDGHPQGQQKRTRKRILRAVFAADIAGFSSKMSLNETSAVTSLSEIRAIGLKELKTYNGWLFGMPGDGLFALFESAVGAVQCGLEIQRVLSGRPHLSDMPMRVGIHLGEVLLDEGLPFGEALNIAARLEALCQPGELLVSATVMDAVSARVSATFEDRGIPKLKNIPRRIQTFAVKQPPARTPTDAREMPGSSLDQTTRLDREALRKVLDDQAIVQIVKREIPAPSDRPTAQVPSSQVPDDAVSLGSQMGFPVPMTPKDDLVEPSDESVLDGSREQPVSQANSDTALTVDQGLADDALSSANDFAGGSGVTSEHQPIQVPEFDPELQGEFDPAPAQPSAKCVEMITKALAVHVGPFSKLIVERYLKGSPRVDDLIALLETHIPDDDEKVTFRVRASHICKTFGHSVDE